MNSVNERETVDEEQREGLAQTLAEEPAASRAPTTMAEVMASLEAGASNDRRHIQMKSAIRSVGRALRRPLCDIPAEPKELRKLLAKVSPAAISLTDRSWSSYQGLTLSALRRHHPDMMPGRQMAGHSQAWAGLRKVLPNRALQHGLSRFMSDCTAASVEPDQVTPEVFEHFRQRLMDRSLCKMPEKTFRQTVVMWNRAVEAAPGWPNVPIPLTRSPFYYSHDWETFPRSFVEDAEAYLNVAANQDEFAEDYRRPLKTGTITARRRHIRQVASLLVGTGFPIEQITSLAVLVEPANATAALKAQQARKGKNTVILQSQTATLSVIAKQWVKKPKRAAELRVIHNRVRNKQTGMTEKNRARLRQFDLRQNKLALLLLPDRVFREAGRAKQGTLAEARRAMYALAVGLLTAAPMRAHSLVALEHNRHIIEIGRGRHRQKHLVIPGAETKTGEDFEMILPEYICGLLDTYLRLYRPMLCAAPSGYLFPAVEGGMRAVIAFSTAASIFVKRETGLDVNLHLFRHIAAKLHLDEHPGDIETVRLLLTHRSTETTIRHYAGHRSAQAFKTYAQTVSEGRSSRDRFALGRRATRLATKPKKIT